MFGADRHVPPLWWRFGALSLLLTAAALAYYVMLRGGVRQSFGDLWFVFLISVNSGVCFMAGFAVSRPLRAFYTACNDTEGRFEKTLGHPMSPVFALLFSGAIALVFRALEPFGADPQGLLPIATAFLFFANLTVAQGIFAILRFWVSTYKLVDRLSLRIDNLSRAPLTDFLMVNRIVVALSAFVTSLAVLSIVLSGLKADSIMFLFTSGAVLLLVATYAIPVFPVALRLGEDKATRLSDIEQAIQARVDGMLAGDMHGKDEPGFSDLVEARAYIASIKTVPPGGQVSISASAFVIFMALLPTFTNLTIDYLGALRAAAAAAVTEEAPSN